MSTSEVHAAVKRAQASQLLHVPEMDYLPNLAAVEEFLVHGIKYAFPTVRGELTRGVPTAYAAEPLSGLIVPGTDPPPVWPYPTGRVRGLSFEPLYKAAPRAALRDAGLHEVLALVDALRGGRVRERQLAGELLKRRLQPAAHA
jgi:hypothetical protein